MTAVGVFGGTFDPVHNGHLHVAREVRRRVGVSVVTFVPCAEPPHKARELSPAEYRVAMLRLAVAGVLGLEVSTIEIDRGGVSFTIDTLRRIAAGPPPCEPLFVMGMDALVDIESWHEHRSLLDEFDLVAVDRPGCTFDSVLARLGPPTRRKIVSLGESHPADRRPPGAGGRIFHLTIVPEDVSSSRVRARAAAGEPLDGLVPETVARYIRSRSLYRQEDTR